MTFPTSPSPTVDDTLHVPQYQCHPTMMSPHVPPNPSIVPHVPQPCVDKNVSPHLPNPIPQFYLVP